ncbi:MAG TPA: hypothetical protein VMH92_00345 [Acidocella sp.]|nr:hypothetical protein [Acidocella sp.]
MRYRIPLLAATLLMPLAASAQPLIQSQEGIALQNEILQMQQQLQQLQGQGGNGGSSLGGNAAPPPSSGGSGDNSLVANLLNQVQQLQSQVQVLNGQVSQLQHQVDTQHDQTEKEIGDLKFQMTGGAGAPAPGAGAGAPSAPPAAAAPQTLAPAAPPLAAAAPNDPKAALKAAIDAYGKHDYTTAASIAKGIVADNRSAPEAYRAQYLVAQAYAAKGDPQNAAINFDATYNMNRNGTYAPRALLGLASSLAAINQNEAACDTISSLNSQFTNPSAGMKSDIAAVSKRAHC